MSFDALKEKALTLPLAPGVYLMRDKDNRVIYVGKAKKLKNRVCQYFQDTASHSLKTKSMVSKVDRFEVIVAASEFEALVLECSLIKRYMPKYNILLKDGKGYPYIRLNMKGTYPSVDLVGKISDDGAEYYGPYGSRGITQDLLSAIRKILKLPDCGKKFPQDIGKGRVCLNYHMNQCEGWCRGDKSQEEYRRVMEQVRHLLRGDYKSVAQELAQQMQLAAEELNFELASILRDRLRAVEILGQRQLVTASSHQDTDVIGYAQNSLKACFSVLHYHEGNLIDKDYEVISAPDDGQQAVSSLLKQYYINSGFAPKKVLLPFEIEDSSLLEQLMEVQFGRKTRFSVPQRGDNARLIDLANANASEELQRVTSRDEHIASSLIALGKMLGIAPPSRIEAFDISNISGTDIVASMAVFENGKPKKSDYKRYKIEQLLNQDDYASMHQVITRRFQRLTQGDKGFDAAPDLVLIDGGATHAKIAREAIAALDLQFNVLGMVKDNRHRTRALVTPEGQEIAIDGQQAVYALIGNIQEEAHRFAITYHRNLRGARLKYSELDAISGIGAKRKEALLKRFKSISAIKEASMEMLTEVLPKDAAYEVYLHFHNQREG